MDRDTLARIDAIMREFDGKETDITSAGRENIRTVNRVARIAALRRVGGETSFRRNVSRYRVDGAADELLIGAERAGGGVWTLIARWNARSC